MIRQAYEFEIITPCFSGGANPEASAEIRASAIRGQLRWWFRLLGGFKSLENSYPNVRDQENFIFGSAASDSGTAGALSVRISQPEVSTKRVNAHDLAPGRDDAAGYLVFPLRDQQDVDKSRGAFHKPDGNGHGRFIVILTLRHAKLAPDNVAALISILGHLGSLGFRGRRALGALRLVDFDYPLHVAFSRFSKNCRSGMPDAPISIREVGGRMSSANQCITELARCLRDCRQHGQSKGSWKRARNGGAGASWIPADSAAFEAIRKRPMFGFARRDHNEGLAALGHAPPHSDPLGQKGDSGQVFRPALGLPIIQKFSSMGDAVRGPASRTNSEVTWGATQDGGRYASPVILRPHKAPDGTWHALVIFVDAKKWDITKPVFLKRSARTVSLDLYEAMKASIPHFMPPT